MLRSSVGGRSQLRMTNGSWRVDETYLRVLASGPICIGKWIPLATPSISYSRKRDADAAKRFDGCLMIAEQAPSRLTLQVRNTSRALVRPGRA